jgi:ABC-type lipoprotein release transport system permease subunit
MVCRTPNRPARSRLLTARAGGCPPGQQGIGLAGAVGFTRALGSLLYDVSVTDRATFIVTTMILAAAALLAALIPALRAARIDPVQALRSE